ncbi:MAG: hypothetical protein JXJ04_05675 [Spirochaetales bacterium]|nr:hypothetical protein [Spirochaetales bacterium]
MNMGKSVIILLLICIATHVFADGYMDGERVLAYWEETELYYIGTIIEYNDTIKGGGYYVVFADGTQGLIPFVHITLFDLKAGSKVLALWSDGYMYPGTIARVLGDAVFINFDDGDKGWTSWAGIARKP